MWLTPEDNSAIVVSLLGLGCSMLLMAHILLRWSSRRLWLRWWFPSGILVGAGIGGSAIFATMVLMFIKTSMHNHIYPDYPLLMLIGMLERLPAWILAGGLTGFAAVLLLHSKLSPLQAVLEPSNLPKESQ